MESEKKKNQSKPLTGWCGLLKESERRDAVVREGQNKRKIEKEGELPLCFCSTRSSRDDWSPSSRFERTLDRQTPLDERPLSSHPSLPCLLPPLLAPSPCSTAKDTPVSAGPLRSKKIQAAGSEWGSGSSKRTGCTVHHLDCRELRPVFNAAVREGITLQYPLKSITHGNTRYLCGRWQLFAPVHLTSNSTRWVGHWQGATEQKDW